MKKVLGRISAFVLAVSLSLTLSALAFAEDGTSAATTGTVAIDLGGKTTPRVIGSYLMAHKEDERFPAIMENQVSRQATDSGSSSDTEEYNTIPTIKGDIKLSTEFDPIPALFGFFEYTGDAFYDTTENTVTMTMPAGVKAVSFRMVVPTSGKANITVKTNDGKIAKTVIENDFSENVEYDQKGFAFYNETAGIKSITITSEELDLSSGYSYNAISIGDVYVDSCDLTASFNKNSYEYTGNDYAKDVLTADNTAFMKKLFKEYAAVTGVSLVKDGKVVTEAKEVGSYDLQFDITNIDSAFLYKSGMITADGRTPASLEKASAPLNASAPSITKTQFDVKFRELVDEIPNEEFKNLDMSNVSADLITSKSVVTVKGIIKIGKTEIPEEETPLAPAENPKTGAQTAAIAIMLVAAASVSATVVLKKKSK